MGASEARIAAAPSCGFPARNTRTSPPENATSYAAGSNSGISVFSAASTAGVPALSGVGAVPSEAIEAIEANATFAGAVLSRPSFFITPNISISVRIPAASAGSPSFFSYADMSSSTGASSVISASLRLSSALSLPFSSLARTPFVTSIVSRFW